MNIWSAGPGMPLLLQCLLHFHPTASTMACFLHFPDLQDPNVPSSLQHGVQAAINLSLQPHYFHPCSQGPMYSVITFKSEIQSILMGMTGDCWIFQAEESDRRHIRLGQWISGLEWSWLDSLRTIFSDGANIPGCSECNPHISTKCSHCWHTSLLWMASRGLFGTCSSLALISFSFLPAAPDTSNIFLVLQQSCLYKVLGYNKKMWGISLLA